MILCAALQPKCRNITGVSEASRLRLTHRDPSAVWLEKLLNPQRPIFKISSSGGERGKLGNVNSEALIRRRSCSGARQRLRSGRFSLPGPPPRLLSAATGSGYEHREFSAKHILFSFAFLLFIFHQTLIRSSVLQHCWPARCFGKAQHAEKAASVAERFPMKLNCHVSAPFPSTFWLFSKIEMLIISDSVSHRDVQTLPGRWNDWLRKRLQI